MTSLVADRKPTVIVVGASRDTRKFGNISVRAHLQHGFEVFPVNPNTDEVEGLKAFRSIREVPLESVDRVTVYLPPTIAIDLLEEIAEKHPREVWMNPGSESSALLKKAEGLGLPIITACSIVDLKT